jgi:hypothetical protein
MAETVLDRSLEPRPVTARVADKVWREVSRPFRRRMRPVHPDRPHREEVPPPVEPAPVIAGEEIPEPEKPYLTGCGASIDGFHPQQATIESECIPFIQRLVRESRKFPGPIVEIGTLIGITTTNLALAKAPNQKIITVDVYCWNPWGLTPEAHEALAAQVLHYLVETGQVERVRMDKNEFFASYQGVAPALVFLDAWHDYEETKKDIEWARSAGARIIAGHDYCDEFPGVKQAVDEFGGPRELAGTAWLL